MRNITTEEFRTIDQTAREILNDHADSISLEGLDELLATLDSMQDSLESASIEVGPDRKEWILRSEENFELLEARVCQLLLLSAQGGGFDKIDSQERLWQ